MNLDPSSLDNLRGIVQSEPVSWWPPAPGWWFVMMLVIAAAAVAIHRQWRRWRSNAYRRAALRELQTANNVSQIAEILKRTALSAYPRTQVARLSGEAWCRWLGAAAGIDVSEPVRASLTSGLFGESSSGDQGLTDRRELATFAADWIRGHAVPSDEFHGSDSTC